VRYDLRVRIGEKFVPLRAQALFQLDIVLHDAVVDDDHVPGPVGMGILLGRRAVGGPPRVGEAEAALEAPLAQPRQLVNFAFLARDLDPAVAGDGNPGRIVPPVLKLLQCVDQYRISLGLPQVTDYSAHFFLLE